MTHEQEVVHDGLDLGLRRHVADLFKVLMASPDVVAFQRFEAGLEKALAYHAQAVAIAETVLDDAQNSAKDGKPPFIGV